MQNFFPTSVDFSGGNVILNIGWQSFGLILAFLPVLSPFTPPNFHSQNIIREEIFARALLFYTYKVLLDHILGLFLGASYYESERNLTRRDRGSDLALYYDSYRSIWFIFPVVCDLVWLFQFSHLSIVLASLMNDPP